METRAKDLNDFTMRNCTNPSIKFLNFSDTFFAKSLLFKRNLAIAPTQIQGEGFTKLYDKFAMSFLNNEIGKDLTTNVEQSMPCHSPFINVSFKEMVSSFLKGCTTCAFEGILKPMEKANVSIGNFKNTAVVAIFIAISWFVLKFACVKAAFTINNACQIGKMKRIVLFWNVQIPMFMVWISELFHINLQVYEFTNQYTHGIEVSPG